MKETKVYTGRRNGKHAELMQRLDKALKEQHFAFVFTKQELKEHDRELVRQVCEKIRKELDGDYNQYRINYILDQIQKDFENGKI